VRAHNVRDAFVAESAAEAEGGVEYVLDSTVCGCVDGKTVGLGLGEIMVCLAWGFSLTFTRCSISNDAYEINIKTSTPSNAVSNVDGSS
jgi:hypothetical protein